MTTGDDSKILVLEDDRTSARAVTYLLAGAGHSVKTAHSAEQAIEIAEGWRPDLLLTDILLDGRRTGFDVASLLRSDHGSGELAVVVMTGLTSSEISRHRGNREVFAVLRKPLVPSELERTVTEALVGRSERITESESMTEGE